MTGIEIATTTAITAAASGLTKIAIDVFRDTSGGFLEHLRGGMDERTRTFIFQALQKYVESYRYRQCQLKVLGMRQPVDLEEVYTSVRLLNTQDIKELESIEALEKAYREQGRRASSDSEKKAKPGIELAREKQYLMVLGSPGAGKSTFLRKIGLEALKGNKGDLRHRCIPVFIELKRLTESTIDIKKLIVQEFQTCSFPKAEEFTNRALKQGRLLILFDGLDEVPTDNLNNAIRTIQDFVDQYKANRFIASCRTAAYRTSFRQFTDVAMANFDNAQMEQFITNWFSNPEDKRTNKAQTCWEVLEQPENQAAKELAQTPLLLTFLCLVYGRAQRFPENRAQLYGKALRILLEEWAAEKAIMQRDIYDGLSTELEEVMLAEIACKAFIKDQFFFSRRELVAGIKTFLASNLNAPQHLDGEAVLNAIAIQQGVFIERADDAYTFSHLTLQEYLVAQYIVDHQRTLELVTKHMFDNRWREVFLLVPGLMRGGSNDLLLQIEAEASAQLNIPELQAFLDWSKQATDGSSGRFKPAAKRVLAIYIALALALAHSQSDSNFGIAITHSQLDAARNLARALDPQLAQSYALNRARDLYRAKALAPDLTIDLALSLDKLKIFKFANFTDLIAKVSASESDSKDESQSHKIFGEPVNCILKIWWDTLQIDPTSLILKDKELRALENYFYANELMVKCKEAAVRVTPELWAEIEERMVTVRE
ncbi:MULTISPECIES: NACHT domain-containing protein [Cyanophyceae]|uniref:NACHT domain-containing protein n=1 Tax=Leptolyngbya subtilissima DQ-A4 TaxID=2933933 RepID=A0ABV0K6M3_9CYAN|nr:NACHT domain-containing protein [Nodosilinea sp. FACHB-141]MBD2113976.1 NACHT domain-containing protein [Nodosilinea sp. FACHB-141]